MVYTLDEEYITFISHFCIGEFSNSLYRINRIYSKRYTAPTVKTDISEALDHETWRRYLLKQCKEQISTLSAGKQVTNRMISWEGKQRARSISNAENGAFKLGCHGHFLPGVCESIPGLWWCNVYQLLGSAALCSESTDDNKPMSAVNSHSALIKVAWPQPGLSVMPN